MSLQSKKEGKRRTVITLSHSNQPAPLQLFAAGPKPGQGAVIFFDGACALDVLDLFFRHAMFSP
jgi:hypothetical protein